MEVLNLERTVVLPRGKKDGILMKRHLILASSSPRRRELLEQVNIPFTIRTSNVDETQITTMDPVKRVIELASLKGKNVEIFHEKEVILSADTIVAYNNHILEKPKNKDEARQMMKLLSGKSHDVLTGVMLRSLDKKRTFVVKTEVLFWDLTDAEIEAYIHTDEPYDKAGGYGIQSYGSIFVKEIIGDYYNVVGLPLSTVVRYLREFQIFPDLLK